MVYPPDGGPIARSPKRFQHIFGSAARYVLDWLGSLSWVHCSSNLYTGAKAGTWKAPTNVMKTPLPTCTGPFPTAGVETSTGDRRKHSSSYRKGRQFHGCGGRNKAGSGRRHPKWQEAWGSVHSVLPGPSARLKWNAIRGKLNRSGPVSVGPVNQSDHGVADECENSSQVKTV